MSRKTKKARADAHRSPVRADSCLSGFWSMPCDLLPAAFPQRFVPLRCAPAAPWPCRSARAFRHCCRFALRFLAAGLPPTLPWGKNPARRGGRGISGSGENFNCPGGGCKEPRRRGPGLPCAQASADFLRDQFRRSGLFLLISAAVLREWQR